MGRQVSSDGRRSGVAMATVRYAGAGLVLGAGMGFLAALVLPRRVSHPAGSYVAPVPEAAADRIDLRPTAGARPWPAVEVG